MKSILLAGLALMLSFSIHAQIVVENPAQGMSTFPGKVSKLEIHPDATILHFKITIPVGEGFSIPEESYIRVVGSDEKLFLTKAEGVEINQPIVVNEHEDTEYSLYFPPIPAATAYLDFGEPKSAEGWMIWEVYDIAVNPVEIDSPLPEALMGNWLKTDGSNDWDYGLYEASAVVDRQLWAYKSVEKKRKRYQITLENDGGERTLYARISKEGTVELGASPDALMVYDTELTDNPNYAMPNDTAFSKLTFRLDSAVYSGVVKGFNPRYGQNTGMIYLSNVITGARDPYEIRIADDGTFSVKLPIYFPRTVYAMMPLGGRDVYIEPGKETWQCLNAGADYLFMGDCARVNIDLASLREIRSSYDDRDYRYIIENIGRMTPQAYMEYCQEARDEDEKQLKEAVSRQFISKKALQIKELALEYKFLLDALSFSNLKSNANYMALSQGKESEVEFYDLDANYYAFIKPNHLSDELALLSGDFYPAAVNALSYGEIFDPYKSGEIRETSGLSELISMLEADGVAVSSEVKEMAAAEAALQDDGNKEKIDRFNNLHGEPVDQLFNKHMDALREMVEKEEVDPASDMGIVHAMIMLVDQLQEEGKEITAGQQKMVDAAKLLSAEESAERKAYHEQYGKIQKAFMDEHADYMSAESAQREAKARYSKMEEVLGSQQGIAFDIMRARDKCERIMYNMIPLEADEIKALQASISQPFVVNYVQSINDGLIAEIALNKKQGGSIRHDIPKTEADQLFAAIMEKFKGKVVYVDFWATWCGPCIAGIKRIAPLKAEMKADNVAFVYITGPSSPEKTYSNMIPGIKGQHFRLSEDEWNYVCDEFGVVGIPHYTLVNKKGEVVENNMDDKSNDELRSILKEQMAL